MEEEDRLVRVVFLRFRTQGRGKNTGISLLPRQDLTLLATPAITYRRVITARALSLPPSFTHPYSSLSLSLSLSLSPSFSFSRTIGMAREIEYLPRQDARSRIHGAIVARSRFFTVILYTSYCIRIIELNSFVNRRKGDVSVV